MPADERSVIQGRPIPSKKMVENQIATALEDYLTTEEVKQYIDEYLEDIIDSRY